MRWIHGGPRRASPTSARWNRLGRIEVARLRVGGERPLHVLLIGDRGALDDLGPDGADLASSTAGALAAATDRGVDLDLLGAPLTSLPAVEDTERFWRLWHYQAFVVLLPVGHAERTRVLQTIERVLPRVRTQSVVLIADMGDGDGVVVPPPPAVGREGRPVGRITVDPAVDGAAVAGAAVATALIDLGMPDPDGPGWDREPDDAARRPGSIPGALAARSGLNRVVLIAKRSFGVDVAAVNLLTGDELVTVAAIGGGLGRRPRAGSLYERVGRGGALDVVPDTWREPALRNDPVVQEPGGIRFYAGHAIDAPNGARVGALCIYDRRPHHPTEFDFSMLRDLALLAEAELVAAGAA